MRRFPVDWRLGVMSGTSLDGVDLAFLRSDGLRIAAFGPARCEPMRGSTVAILRAALNDRSLWPAAEAAATEDHIAAIRLALASAPGPVAQIGYHGQTVFHDPAAGVTVQLGDPQAVADAAGVAVVGKLRDADMAAGGQGAPIVPVFHQALSRDWGDGPFALLNVGGVANVTWIDGARLAAFDTGTGGALLDDWMLAQTGRAMDENGAAARAGEANADIVAAALDDPYIRAPHPKSLDRNHFMRLLAMVRAAELSVNDGAATLTEITAAQAAAGIARLGRPRRVIVCGGGRRNLHLMARLSALCGVQAEPSEAVSLDGDALEAQAMAFLAARFAAGLPTTFPQTTGCKSPVVGGKLFAPTQ